MGQGRGRGEKQPASQGKQMITLGKGRGEYYGKFPKCDCVENDAVKVKGGSKPGGLCYD